MADIDSLSLKELKDVELLLARAEAKWSLTCVPSEYFAPRVGEYCLAWLLALEFRVSDFSQATDSVSSRTTAHASPPPRRLKELTILILIIWQSTRVSAFREILPSLQCKIVQYTFLGQYLIKLRDFFSQCKIPHPAWLQLNHNNLGPSWIRLFRPLYYKTEKTLFQMWYTALKNIHQGIYWVLNVSGYIWQ